MEDPSTRISLLQRVRDPSDQAAWREFDALYRPLLMRFARARGLADPDAEEVVQQCMAALATYMHRFTYDATRGRFKGWLCTVVNNRIRNQRRDRKEFTDLPDGIRKEQTGEPTPEEVFEQVWMQEHLQAAMRQLETLSTPRDFGAYRRYVIEEAEVDTVCREFEISPNQLYKIKWKLTQELRELFTAISE